MTTKRKPGRPAGSGIYTVRRQIVLDPQLAEAWREMCAKLGGTESKYIRMAMRDWLADRASIHAQDGRNLDASPKS